MFSRLDSRDSTVRTALDILCDEVLQLNKTHRHRNVGPCQLLEVIPSSVPSVNPSMKPIRYVRHIRRRAHAIRARQITITRDTPRVVHTQRLVHVPVLLVQTLLIMQRPSMHHARDDLLCQLAALCR